MPKHSSACDQVLSVSQLTQLIQETLQSTFSHVVVEGEISGFKRATSGHCYFALKDDSSLLNCVIWRSSTCAAVDVADGQQVRAHGSIGLYPVRGQYQLYVTRVEPAGRGLLQKRLEELKAKLQAEGLFDQARKRNLPLLPRRVAVITSPTGAALRDFLKVLRGSETPVLVTVFPARVQGIEAAAEIAQGLEQVSTTGRFDVAVVTRGGGSLEDLWAFNEEVVARAIVACQVPVMSAVGHEVDYTIADFVSDLRAPTPTAAGTIIAECFQELRQQVQIAQEHLVESMEYELRTACERVDGLGRVLRRFHPELLIATARQRVDECSARLGHRALGIVQQRLRDTASLTRHFADVFAACLAARRTQFQVTTEKLHSLGPRAALLRGWALCQRRADNRLISSVTQLATGEDFKVTFHDGQVSAVRVER